MSLIFNGTENTKNSPIHALQQENCRRNSSEIKIISNLEQQNSEPYKMIENQKLESFPEFLNQQMEAIDQEERKEMEPNHHHHMKSLKSSSFQNLKEIDLQQVQENQKEVDDTDEKDQNGQVDNKLQGQKKELNNQENENQNETQLQRKRLSRSETNIQNQIQNNIQEEYEKWQLEQEVQDEFVSKVIQNILVNNMTILLFLIFVQIAYCFDISLAYSVSFLILIDVVSIIYKANQNLTIQEPIKYMMKQFIQSIVEEIFQIFIKVMVMIYIFHKDQFILTPYTSIFCGYYLLRIIYQFYHKSDELQVNSQYFSFASYMFKLWLVFQSLFISLNLDNLVHWQWSSVFACFWVFFFVVVGISFIFFLMLCSKIWSNTYSGSRQLKTKNNFETKGIFWVFTLLLSLCCTSCCTVIGISQYLDNHTLAWSFSSLYVSCSFLVFEISVFLYLKNDLKQFIKNIFFDEEEQVQLESRRQQRNNGNPNVQYSTFNIQNQLPHINQIINNININFIHNYQFYSHQRQSYKQKTKLREVQVQGNLNFPQFVMKCSSTYFKFLNLKNKRQKVVPINQNQEQKFQDQVDIEKENKSQISLSKQEKNQSQLQNQRVVIPQPIDSEDQINRKNYQDMPHLSNSTTDKRLSRDQYKKLLVSKLFQNNSFQVCTIDDMPLNSAKADHEIKTSRNYNKTDINLDIDYTHRQQLKKLFQIDKDCFNNKIFKKRNESKSSLNLECQITQENYDVQNKSLPFISNIMNLKSQQINELDNLTDQIRSAQIIRDIEQQLNKENNKHIKFLSQNSDFPVSPTFYDPKQASLNQNYENAKANNIMNANNNLNSNANSNSNTKDNTNANTNTNSQIDIKSSTSQQIICLVCFDSECNSIFAPCGHGGLCYQCALDVFKKQGDCLLCRKKVTEIYKYIEVVEDNPKKDQSQKYFQIQTITKYLDSNQNSMIKKQRLQNKNSLKNTVYTQGEIEQQIQQYSFYDFDEFGNQIISEQQVQNQSGNKNSGMQNSSSIQSNKEQSLQQQQKSMLSSLNVISPLNSDRERQKNSNIKKYNDIIQHVTNDHIQNRQLRSITQQSDHHARFLNDQLQIQQELFVPQFQIDKDFQSNLIFRQSPKLINYQRGNQEMATTQATDAFQSSQSQHQIFQDCNQKFFESNIQNKQNTVELNNAFKQKDNKSKNTNLFSENFNFPSRQNAIISNKNNINPQKKTQDKSILKDCNFDNQTDFIQRQHSFNKQ
ncbi:hypothetical protein ABPG72_000433 [Tetrahymena utriculariae]